MSICRSLKTFYLTVSCLPLLGNDHLYACCEERETSNVIDKDYSMRELARAVIYEKREPCCQEERKNSENNAQEEHYENHHYDEAEIELDKCEDTRTNSHIYDDPESVMSNRLDIDKEESHDAESNNVEH